MLGMYTSRYLGATTLLTLGLALVASGPSQGTVCAFAETRVDNLHVLVCANHGRWNYATLLYYKGLAQLLGESAREWISGSSAKQVEIMVIDPVMADSVFAVDLDERSYRLDCRGLVSLRLFAQGLHYLAAGYGPLRFAERIPPPDKVLLEMLN